MIEQPRFSLATTLPPLVGLAWLWCASALGLPGALLATVPGALLLAAGVSTLLYPGDVRIPQFLALGAALGVGLGLAFVFLLGPAGLLLLAASAASFLAAGRTALRQEPPCPQVPAAIPSLRLDGEIAIDETILATLTLRWPRPGPDDHARIIRELGDARSLFAERGWIADPESYHRRPGPPEHVDVLRATVGTLSYEHVRFESAYEPWPDEPGRDRWLSLPANRRAHAWVLRHGAPRPWLVCIHGYEMGVARTDFSAFRARYLHDRLGINLAFPALPLHGPRRTGRRSGAGYLGPDLLDSVHAQAQAMWDLRRLVAWIRTQGDGPIGVYGLSLGGYNAALLASLEPLDLVLAGVPAVDFHRLTRRHGSPLSLLAAEVRGLIRAEVDEVFRPISPLALAPRVACERRAIFAGIADRIVPADQPRDLWLHWERPRIVWYPGGHVSFRSHPAVARLIDDSLRVGGLVPALGPI